MVIAVKMLTRSKCRRSYMVLFATLYCMVPQSCLAFVSSPQLSLPTTLGRIQNGNMRLGSSNSTVQTDRGQRVDSTSQSTETKPGGTVATKARFIRGPPLDTRPDYDSIHGPLGRTVDKMFLSVFRTKLAEKVGVDSKLPKDDYNGLMELTAAMNARYSDRIEVQKIAQEVLRSLFPSWLPGKFRWMFAKPFPEFSARLNAWATLMAGTWLMGECEMNNVEVDGGGTGMKQGLLVKRCRFLEESGCASVCVNSCKIPTQAFFNEDMGLPLTMTPDYETGECQFSFGLTPTYLEEFKAKNVPCLENCPSSGKLRIWHDGVDNRRRLTTHLPIVTNVDNSVCPLMEDDGQ